MYRLNYNYVFDKSKEEFSRVAFINRERTAPLSFQILENAIVCPYSRGEQSGVVTHTGEFISSSSFNGGETRSTSTIFNQLVSHRSEVVIYIGCFYHVWGHCVLDNLRRLWFLETDNAQQLLSHGAKIVYTCHLGSFLPDSFKQLLDFANISTDNWEEIVEPTQFEKVILPDATFCYADNASFSKEHLVIIDRILNKIRVCPKVDKVYFTRASLKNNVWREYGESLLEREFSKKGYLIVSPEMLSIETQLGLLKNCRYFAATEGSVAHNAIFCRPGTYVTIIRKANYVNDYQLAVNQMRHLDVTYVDAHHSVPPYPNSIWIGPFYICVTRALERYLGYRVVHLPYWIKPSYWWYVFRRKSIVEKYLANRKVVHRLEQCFASRKFGYVSFRVLQFLPQFLRLWLIERGRYFLSPMPSVCSPTSFEILHEFPIIDKYTWCERLNRVARFDSRLKTMVWAFCTSDIRILQSSTIIEKSPIFICVQKNDFLRIKSSILYHRKLGVKNFVILDNGSTDGSVEWLKMQPDVFLLQTYHPYSSQNRDAWINRIFAYFGDNRWYVVLDSDEFLSYEDMEHRDINQVVAFLSTKHIKRARAMMLDMYADDGYFEQGKRDDFMHKCIYFDKDTYTSDSWDYHFALNGGPRKRLFNTNATLTKYPLFYLSKGELLYQAHAMFPLWKNLNTPCHLVIRHYKFLPGERIKFEKIAQEGTYYGGSIEYKNYVAKMTATEILKFKFGGSDVYHDSSSLKSITCYTPIMW